ADGGPSGGMSWRISYVRGLSRRQNCKMPSELLVVTTSRLSGENRANDLKTLAWDGFWKIVSVKPPGKERTRISWPCESRRYFPSELTPTWSTSLERRLISDICTAPSVPSRQVRTVLSRLTEINWPYAKCSAVTMEWWPRG